MAKKKSKRKKPYEDQVVDMRRDPLNRKQCYLVWSLQTSGLTQLRAIDTSRKIALDHRKACVNDEHNVIRAWVETRDMDHLYGHKDVTEYQITNRQELIRTADSLRSLDENQVEKPAKAKRRVKKKCTL